MRTLPTSALLLMLSVAACTSPNSASTGENGGGGSGGAQATSSSGGDGTSSSSEGGSTTTSAQNGTYQAAFRTQVTGQYLTAVNGGGADLTATSFALGKDQIFTLIDLNGGALMDGDLVQIAAPNGQFLTAVDGGGGALLANVSAPGDFETFAIQRLAGPSTIATGDDVAFKAKLQLEYISANKGGGGIVAVNEPHALAWETFAIGLDPVITDDPALAARDAVLGFLQSTKGNHTLSGQHNKYNQAPGGATDQVASITGSTPALWSADFGFGHDMVDFRADMIAEAKAQWSKGAVVQIMYHTCVPTSDEYCSWDDIGGNNAQHLSDADWNDLVTDGTPLNQAWKARLDTLSVFFADLQAAGIAPLFRPLHEMNQGVFWWGGRPGPNGTRKLFQITRDYLVGQKGFTNILWVWDMQDFGSLAGDLDDYDPGQSYYDIAALDFYNGDGYTQSKHDLMAAKAGNKPMAIGECDAPPTPGDLSAQPDWIFFMLWPDFIDQNNGSLPTIYDDSRVINREEMPGW